MHDEDVVVPVRCGLSSLGKQVLAESLHDSEDKLPLSLHLPLVQHVNKINIVRKKEKELKFYFFLDFGDGEEE